MSIWALSDPHLSFGSNKPMDVFGAQWDDHPRLISENWIKQIKKTDTVLISGDISWAMNFYEVLPDLQFIDALPGQKLLGRGNHDYWWNSMRKMESFCEANGIRTIRFMRNNAFLVEDKIVCNTRGWILPGDKDFKAEDEKIYRRELMRLRLSLDSAAALRLNGQEIVASFHYPPLGPRGYETELTRMLHDYGVKTCIYGHVHGKAARYAFNGERDGICYYNTACDYLDFKPLLLYND